MSVCNHAATSNTDQVFYTFAGCTVKGMLNSGSNRILVFECGWGLAISSVGSHWTETPDTTKQVVGSLIKSLAGNIESLNRILELAGEKP